MIGKLCKNEDWQNTIDTTERDSLLVMRLGKEKPLRKCKYNGGGKKILVFH